MAFAALAMFFLLLFGPTVKAAFYVIEDHTLLGRSGSLVSDWWSHVLEDAHQLGRFRPGYWLYVVASYQAFGVNPHLWHAAALAWGTLTCWLFYLAMRMIGCDIASTIIFVLLIAIGRQNWVWINLVPAETSGVLLTAIATWIAVFSSRQPVSARWQIVNLAAIALAGLTKESFVILIPALLFLRLVCQVYLGGLSWTHAVRTLRAFLAAGAVIFAAELSAVAAVVMVPSGQDDANAESLSARSFDPRHWMQLLQVLPVGVLVAAAGAAVTWAILVGRSWLDRSVVLAAAATIALWTVPQLVLYANGLDERYLFPMLIGLSASVALALSVVRHTAWSAVWLVGVAALLPSSVAGISSTSSLVGYLVAETRATDRMVRFLADNVPASEAILMAGDPGTAYGFESSFALSKYLQIAGSRSQFFLWPLVSRGERSPIHIASKRTAIFTLPASLTAADVGAIVLVEKDVPPFDFGPLLQWLGPTEWRELNFVEPLQAFSMRELRYAKLDTVRHRILVPAATREVPVGRPLVSLDASLALAVSIGQLLDLPRWGIESSADGKSFLWIGSGREEGLGWTLSASREQSIEVAIDAVPGPSRPGGARTVSLMLENRAGRLERRTVFDGNRWSFVVTLEPGMNRVRVEVDDAATVAVQPNGDSRRLMALLRHIVILPAKN